MRHGHHPDGGIVWNVSAGLAIGLGTGMLASQSLAVACVVWLISTSMAGSVFFVVALAVETPRGMREICRDVVAWGIVMSATMGLSLLSPAALLPAVVLLGTAPAVRRLAQAWWAQMKVGPCFAGGDGSTQRPRPLVVTDEVTDADLWRAWDSSEERLARPCSPEARLREAEFRAVLLDELDRRREATGAGEHD